MDKILKRDSINKDFEKIVEVKFKLDNYQKVMNRMHLELINDIEEIKIISEWVTDFAIEHVPDDSLDERGMFMRAIRLLPKNYGLVELLEKIEKELVEQSLDLHGQIQIKAAEHLKISKSLLQYKIKKYNIIID